jgi:hypothetical protein
MLAQAQAQLAMNEAGQQQPPDTTPIEFEKIASAERQTVAKLQSEAEVKAADANKKRIEAEAIVKELMLKEQELMLKAQDMQLREKEVGIAERGADREDFTAKAAVEHKGAELGMKNAEMGQNAKRSDKEMELAERNQDVAEYTAEAGVSQKDTELGIKDRVARTGAKKVNNDAKADEAKAAEKPKKKHKTVTRVTKHDAKGRILEFEQEDVDD